VASGLRFGVEVRRAAAADAPEIARLLAEAGAALSAADAADRLEAMRLHADCAVLVTAGYAGLNGLVAVHWAPVLQSPRPVARLTALVVDADERRHGIGRLLLKAASQAARSGGCDTLEVAADDGQSDLAAFCRAAGFVEEGQTFARSLRKRGAEPGNGKL
jgi:aminoglycoside 6'-N-acetyltransferase I